MPAIQIEELPAAAPAADEDVLEEPHEEPDSSFVEAKPVVPAAAPVAAPIAAPMVEVEKEDAVSSSTPAVKAPSPVKAEPSEPKPDLFAFVRLLPPVLVDLLYWRDVPRSGLVVSSLLLVLITLSLHSAIAVVAHIGLLLLVAAFAYVSFKKIVAAVHKTGEGHPFKEYLGSDLTAFVPGVDNVKSVIKTALEQFGSCLESLRHYFLVVSIVDSLKFGLVLYLLTYVGEAMNLLSVVILVVSVAFSLPKIYELRRDQIDAGVAAVIAQLEAQWPVLKKTVVDRLVAIWQKLAVYVPVIGGETAVKEKAN